MTRKVGAAFAVIAMVGASVALMAGTASGGEPPILEITKVIEGEAPPGAEFVVDITCSNGAAATPAQLTFTEGGTQPVSVNSGDTTCTVTESETAGALEVRYACEIVSQPGLQEATCTDGQNVVLDGGGSITAFTVTNDYVPEPPPPPVPEPVVAEVNFTG